jgi:hypothetical protein
MIKSETWPIKSGNFSAQSGRGQVKFMEMSPDPGLPYLNLICTLSHLD